MKNKKSIYETHQKLIDEEWDYEKNNELGLDPRKITYGSDKKAWWICKQGHKWEATINNRHNGKGCPYCYGRKVCKNDSLAIKFPKILEEWNYKKNIKLDPYSTAPYSSKKIWWICKKKHEWKARVFSRSSGCGCPYCSGRQAADDNCFLKTHPEPCKEWDYLKNGILTPKNVNRGSHKKVWWKCNEGHEWETTVHNRGQGNGCPKCAIKRRCGKNNCNYNPNLTDKDREDRRLLPEYQFWVKNVFKKDNYICQKCNNRGGDLNAHHLMGYDKYVELRFNIDNGITLCKICHDNFHNIYGRGDNTLQQFKEHIININNELLILPIFEKLKILEEYIFHNNIQPIDDHLVNCRI